MADTHGINLSGKRFGRLIVTEVAQVTPKKKWKCICDCGSVIVVVPYSLTSGNTKSCGCLQRENRSKFLASCITHGHAGHNKRTREYVSWKSAKTRCFNKKSPDFKYYGGDGISMCKEWRNNFALFLKEMGPCPDGYTLERINRLKDYEPGNCKWASREEQVNNTRRNIFVTVNGVRLTLGQLAKQIGKSYESIRLFYWKHGEKALMNHLFG